MHPAPTRILLSEHAASRFGDRIRRVASELARPIEQLVLNTDGQLLHEGVRCQSSQARAEIAWATVDLFIDGPLAEFKDVVDKSAELRWFQTPAPGLDDPMYPALLARGIRLTNGHASDVVLAEFVLRAALDHAQHAHRWRNEQAAGVWGPRHRFREIGGMTWLLVGYGATAEAIAVRARAFGTRVIGVRRCPTGTESADHMITPTELSGPLAAADVVVINAPATPETYHLVDRQFLDQMMPTALLINVARGWLLDENALIEALDAGRPAAAVLDVFATEPLPSDSPLWAHPHITITPHNAALGDGSSVRMADLFADNLARYLTGQPMRYEVGPGDLHRA